jgi:hypothetical protein
LNSWRVRNDHASRVRSPSQLRGRAPATRVGALPKRVEDVSKSSMSELGVVERNSAWKDSVESRNVDPSSSERPPGL